MKRKYFPILVILVCTTGMTHAQTTVLTNVRPLLPLSFLGWDGTGGIPGSLEIRNDFAGQPINFFTGGSTPLFQRMIINGSTGPTAGFVGIGNNFTTPLYPLDVQDNINVNTTGFLNGYRINGFTVLQTPALENVFVGRGSAANFTGSTLGQNTFVGFNAGGSYISSNTSGGDRNTFVGRAAGFAMITTDHFNGY